MTDYLKDEEYYNVNIGKARLQVRSLLNRLIVLSSSIVGFSVSLFSTQQFSERIDFVALQWSWRGFVGVIILSFFCLMIYSRVQYAKTWKSVNTLSHDAKTYPFSYKFLAVPFAFFSLFVPANMIFNRFAERSWFSQEFRNKVNQYTVHELAWIEHRIPLIENVVIALFVISLVVLVESVKI